METQKPALIPPAVGRKVWYWPTEQDKIGRGCMQQYGFTKPEQEQPFDATVIATHGDRMVNLYVIDHMGRTHIITSCQLLQPGDEVPYWTVPVSVADKSGERKSIRASHCTWMPYQIGQAMKHAMKDLEPPAADTNMYGATGTGVA